MTTITERKQTRPFADWLRDHKKGAVHDELSEKLADLALASLEHQKVGTLTLTIKITPNRDGQTLFVNDDVKFSPAKADRGGNTFYADVEGNLTRTDPNQMELEPLRVVETSGDEPVVLDTATGEVRSID